MAGGDGIIVDDELIHRKRQDAPQDPRERSIVSVVKRAGQGFVRDKSPRIAAALSYYATVALAPLLIVAIAVLGLLMESTASRAFLVAQATNFAGPQVGKLIGTILAGAGNGVGSGAAAVIGIVAAVIGAAGGFWQLQDALNTVWNVSKKPEPGIKGIVVSRLPSFLMLVVVVMLLFTSAVASTIFGSLNFPLLGAGTRPSWLLESANVVISLGVLTLAFAAVYKVLPDADVPWRDVWFGAGLTAALFTIGKTVLGVYLGHSAVASAFGAAGSLVLLLIWVYYSAQVVLFGAEFTQVWACTYGSRQSYPSSSS